MALAFLLLFPLVVHAASRDCEALAKLKLENAALTAESVPAGNFQPPAGQPVPGLPAFCRVAGVIKPSSDSDIRFEVWLPAAEWNGKFQGIGNGGFAGSISYSQLGVALSRGYATASTNTGHEAAGGIDATWALGHPEKVIDFGHRAIHETAVKAKAIVRAYYGEGPKRSYFSSCSNGGRQALMEAQRYPEDYDGIIAGAPANHWTRLMSNAAELMRITQAEQGGYIPASKLRAIQDAALAACDHLDGVRDGVVENPARCRPDPAKLVCQGAESDTCLTAPQAAALKKIWEGTSISPGYSCSGEAEPGGFAGWITGKGPETSALFLFSTQFFKNMVYADPNWDYRKFNLGRDSRAAEEKVGRHLNAVDPDLSRFQARGGKLILYHGWNDAAIPALHLIEYYDRVLSKVGKDKAASFVRLFMAPGVQHCGAGAGPNNFGQGRPGVEGDALHDIDAALERWVEGGIAPDRLIATHQASKRTRPLCPYPLTAQWTGSGSTDDAANFTCAPEKR